MVLISPVGSKNTLPSREDEKSKGLGNVAARLFLEGELGLWLRRKVASLSVWAQMIVFGKSFFLLFVCLFDTGLEETPDQSITLINICSITSSEET